LPAGQVAARRHRAGGRKTPTQVGVDKSIGFAEHPAQVRITGLDDALRASLAMYGDQS
jgi:hypothetical protein